MLSCLKRLATKQCFSFSLTLQLWITIFIDWSLLHICFVSLVGFSDLLNNSKLAFYSAGGGETGEPTCSRDFTSSIHFRDGNVISIHWEFLVAFYLKVQLPVVYLVYGMVL